MKYTEEMILQSESGYCMPFEETQGKEVEMTLGYGEQTHPATGERFFHHGVDFNAKCYAISAVASGVVSAIANTPAHGICQTIRYGQYEVTYGHLSNVFACFGQRVKAGSIVALSGDRLHMEVRFKGEELNPLEFLTMLYGNVKATQQNGRSGIPDFPAFEMTMPTDYDRDREERTSRGDRAADDALPACLSEGFAARRLHAFRTHRAVAAPPLHDGCREGVFLRVDAQYVQPARIGSEGDAACLQGAEPAHRRLSELFGAAARCLSLDDGRCSKKKLHGQALADSGIIDPLAELDVDVQSFDIPRIVSVYPDRSGVRFWTKAWFNNREEGEASVEIEREQAIRFMQGNVEKDAWLEEYFPRAMEVYHNAIEQTKEQLLGRINM